MLRGAEPFAANSVFVDKAFVEALVWEHPLPAQRHIEVAKAFVSEGAVNNRT